MDNIDWTWKEFDDLTSKELHKILSLRQDVFSCRT